MNNSSAQKMPSQKQVHKHWVDDPDNIFEDLEINQGGESACMACGWDIRPQRAHIIARSEGGGNEPSNIHLLCPNCHLESETLNEKYYWIWFKNKNQKFKTNLVFERLVEIGRDPKEVFSLLNDGEFYEAAKWFAEHKSSAFKTEESLQVEAKWLKKRIS